MASSKSHVRCVQKRNETFISFCSAFAKARQPALSLTGPSSDALLYGHGRGDKSKSLSGRKGPDGVPLEPDGGAVPGKAALLLSSSSMSFASTTGHAISLIPAGPRALIATRQAEEPPRPTSFSVRSTFSKSLSCIWLVMSDDLSAVAQLLALLSGRLKVLMTVLRSASRSLAIAMCLLSVSRVTRSEVTA